jgi:putative heme iron utilization protein
VCYHLGVVDSHQRPASPDERAAAAVRAPTHAERCRTLVHGARAATLSTVALEPAGFPYGSLVTIAFDERGRPLLLLSTLAEHTKNLLARGDASVLVTEPLGAHDQPLAVGRVTILGACGAVEEREQPAVRATFLAQQPSASYYVDFKDFAFYRLEPASLRYVGGFGRMSWVSAEDYRAAEPDPLAGAAAGILTHMNDDHADSVLAYARVLAGVAEATAATMTAVDRYGFELAATTPSGPRAARVAFDEPVATGEEVRRAMVQLAKRARA